MDRAAEVLGNLTSMAILSSSIMLNPDRFLVVTRTQSIEVSRVEFVALMDTLKIRMAVKDRPGVQNLYIIKHLGQTRISNDQGGMPSACYTGSDGVFLATSLISVTKKITNMWKKLLSLSLLLPQMQLLDRASKCIPELNLDKLDLEKLYGCTKAFIYCLSNLSISKGVGAKLRVNI